MGKAFWEAGKQAVKSAHGNILTSLNLFLPSIDAKHSPQSALGNDVDGVGTATSGSATDQLTRLHRMTVDEAHMILNVKRGDSIEAIMKVCYHHVYFDLNMPTRLSELRAPVQGQLTKTRKAYARPASPSLSFALSTVKSFQSKRTVRS